MKRRDACIELVRPTLQGLEREIARVRGIRKMILSDEYQELVTYLSTVGEPNIFAHGDISVTIEVQGFTFEAAPALFEVLETLENYGSFTSSDAPDAGVRVYTIWPAQFPNTYVSIVAKLSQDSAVCRRVSVGVKMESKLVYADVPVEQFQFIC